MLVINRFYSITLLQLMIILVQRFINVYTTHSIYFLINPKNLEQTIFVISERHYHSPSMVFKGYIGGVCCNHGYFYHNNREIWK